MTPNAENFSIVSTCGDWADHKEGKLTLGTKWVATFGNDTHHADISMTVAAGPWTHIVDCPVKPGLTNIPVQSGTVHFTLNLQTHPSQASKAEVRIYDPFVIESEAGSERRLVALDRQGRVVFELNPHEVNLPVNELISKQGYQTQSSMPANLLPRIAEFRLLLRPCQEATFHNVALEPATVAVPPAPAH